MYEIMNIVTKLDQLGVEVLRRYPDINSGGCCVYAAMIVAALHKHKIKAQGIVASWNAERMNYAGASIDTIRHYIVKNTLTEWEDNGISFSHVGVEFEYKGLIRKTKRHYDTSGVRPAGKMLDSMPIYKGRLDLNELRTLAGRKDGWNSTFDRKQIPALRTFVKNFLAVDKV